MNGFDIETINPGVRKLVQLLRDLGFATTDSGDGVTNVEAGMEGALDIPHVFMKVNHEREANRLMTFLGIERVRIEPGMIQYSYDPSDGSRILALYGVSDKDLP